MFNFSDFTMRGTGGISAPKIWREKLQWGFVTSYYATTS